jgi:predicted nucleic acid-binding protein
MSVLVVDASVAAKWFFVEAHSEEARLILDEQNDLHSPDFMYLEFDKFLKRKIERGETDKILADEIRCTLERYPIQTHPFLPFRELAWEISNQTGTSVYDCLYMALAVLLECQVLTADVHMVNSMHKSEYINRVQLLDGSQ